MKKRTAWIILTIVISLAWARGHGYAQEGGPTMQVTVGYDGYCRSDGWCPLFVVLSNEGADIEGELRVAVREGGGSDEPNVYARRVLLPARSRKAYFLYLPSTRSSPLIVQLRAGDEVLASKRVAVAWLDERDWLYGVASSDPSALNFLSDVAPASGKAVVAHLDLESLPPDPLGWEGLDVLVLSDVDTTVLDGDQRRAMETWVIHGGHLIVGGGAGAARTVAGVADLLPVTVGGTRSVHDLWALGEQVSAAVATGPYAVAEADLRDGEMLVEQRDEQGDLVLLARRYYGVGTVDFLAFDAGLNPFTRWDDNGLLWEWIVGIKGAGTRRLTVRNGYNARDAVNAIPGLELPSTLQILAFMLVYTLLIGPANYLILRKLNRRELAWLTIPALILGFTLCAYVTGFQIRGGMAIVHRLAVVHVPESTLPASGAAVGRVSEVVGLFSPRRTTYDVWLADAEVREIPVDYYGPAAQPLHIVEEAGGSTVTGLRVDVGGIQPFVAEGYVDVSGVEADLRLVGVTTGVLRLEGTLRSEETPLEEAVLIVGRYEQRLGNLEPGKVVTVNVRLAGVQVTGGGAPSYGPHALSEQILGPGNYWDDHNLYRRYQLLQAIFVPHESFHPRGASGGGGIGLGPGVHLVGWTEEAAPLPVEIVNRPFSTAETALYVYDLPVAGLGTGARVTIPPGLMTREVVETKGYVDVWPEGFYMEPGSEVTFRFTIWPGMTVSQVEELELELRSSGASHRSPAVSLWNQESGDWERLDVGWGQHSVPNAGAYVLPSGDVLVRLHTGAELSADVEGLVITIKGQR